LQGYHSILEQVSSMELEHQAPSCLHAIHDSCYTRVATQAKACRFHEQRMRQRLLPRLASCHEAAVERRTLFFVACRCPKRKRSARVDLGHHEIALVEDDLVRCQRLSTLMFHVFPTTWAPLIFENEEVAFCEFATLNLKP